MKGIGLIEVMLAMSLTLGILGLAMGAVSYNSRSTREVHSRQDRLESVFHAVDAIRSDLGKCGMRLQRAFHQLSRNPLTLNENGFSICWGESVETIMGPASRGELFLPVTVNSFFKQGKDVVICSETAGIAEEHRIRESNAYGVYLEQPLKNDFPENSELVAKKSVEYRYFSQAGELKRKVDRGGFQPLLTGASDFYVHYFPETHSILYRIELNKKEQIRGYLFLVNLVQP